MPGADLILTGLDDLHRGKNDTTGALLVAIASTRLTTAGLDVPREHLVSKPELLLYDQLQEQQDDAYSYYNALLQSLNSFCNTLELMSCEICLLVEGSDRTLKRNRTLKAKVDAQSGITDYWILDIPNHQLWVLREPSLSGY